MTSGPGPFQSGEHFLAIYNDLRKDCHNLEFLINELERAEADAKFIKRLDKAVFIMKVGFKTMKKAMKKESARKRKLGTQLKVVGK